MPKPQPLFEPCPTCRGCRLAPDHAIHETLPDHSPKVLRPRRPRAGRAPCPGCSGIGYLKSDITRDFVVDLATEHDAALAVLRAFVDLYDARSDDAFCYFDDADLRGIYGGSLAVLARDETTPKKPARNAAR